MRGFSQSLPMALLLAREAFLRRFRPASQAPGCPPSIQWRSAGPAHFRAAVGDCTSRHRLSCSAQPVAHSAGAEARGFNRIPRQSDSICAARCESGAEGTEADRKRSPRFVRHLRDHRASFGQDGSIFVQAAARARVTLVAIGRFRGPGAPVRALSARRRAAR